MSIPLERLKAALSDRYAIAREIGRGGTATVYLGHDARHARSVAIKVLNPTLAASLAAERFLREIEISAALTHPHILPVLDSGRADGFLFYVMPYVDGESLRERLEREGELPLADAVRIGREVADGLAHAHARGVVHRDIKPGNVLLSGRHAMIADFGVARAIRRAGDEELTGTGLAVGTPAYMSPEQAAGDDHVDARSDVYAVGCLLYEMLTGRPPLTGRTPQATLARRMTESPPPVRGVRETVPPELERAVMRALARSPADRFPSAEALAGALRRVGRASLGAPAAHAASPSRTAPAGGSSRAPSRSLRRKLGLAVGGVLLAAAAVVGVWAAVDSGPSSTRGEASTRAATADLRRIAVLPFDDISEDRRLGHLAAGFTRALIDELSGVEALKVVSYNGVAPFAGSGIGTDSVARALDVGALVAGAISESGDLLRVRVELIEAGSGELLDTERFERRRGELFVLQDEIARELAEHLRARLGTEVRLRERAAATQSAEAWELVQRAEELRREHRPLREAGRTEEALEVLDGADELLARAESLDRGWVEPTVVRGWVAERRADLLNPAPERYDERWAREALGHAERVLRERPGDAGALELRGTVRFRLHRQAEDPAEASRFLQAARTDLEAAVRADPSLASAWSTLAKLHQSQGEYLRAKRAAERAYEADAFLADHAGIVSRMANMALELGDHEEALRWTERGRRQFPDVVDFPALELLALASGPPETVPDPERAWRLYDRIDLVAPLDRKRRYLPMARMYVAAVLAQAGMEDSARALVLRTRAEADETVAADIGYEEANAWLRLDRPEEAIEALRRHLAANPSRRQQIARDDWFRDLREDPRFRELVAGPR